ncbi:MAG: DUF2066 domain-containing protein [Gammaproteobacteria bacterium]
MIRLTTACVLAVLASASPAAPVAGLNEAQVPVAGRSEADRAAATRAALAAVLVKMTGDRQAPARAPGLLRDANRFAQRFQYLTVPAPEGNGTALELRVGFDARGLGAALAGAGLSAWTRERPRVAVWISGAPIGPQALVGADDATGIAEAVRQRASARAVPVVLPRADEEDSARLGTNAGAPDFVAASGRYGANAVAAAVLAAQPGGTWEAQWTLWLDDGSSQWSSQGATPAAAVEAGVDLVADALARALALPAEAFAAQPLELVVRGVRNVADYARVQKYLASIDGVTAVSVRAAEADRLRIGVTVRGGAQALARAVTYGSVLSAAADGQGIFDLIGGGG